MLAALLLDPTTLDQVQELLKPEHFYAPAHGRIYDACLALAQQGTAFDLTTVGSWLRSRERLADVGGVPYLAKITDATPEVANIDAYARIVREKWRVRELIKTCQRIAAEGYGDVGQVQNFIDTAEQAIYDLARTPESSTVSHLGDVIRTVFSKLEEIGQRGSSITGFPTGFKKLDELTSGLHPTDLVIVAARPGMGKCLVEDSEIVLGDGRVATIKEVVQAQQAELLTLDANARLRLTSPSHFVDDGVKPSFRVQLRSGRTIETTLTHPFLTPTGWRPLMEITVGHRVAVPRRIPIFGSAPWRSCEVKLLGYLLGDGCLTEVCPLFTNSNPRLLEDFSSAVDEFGGASTQRAEAAGKTPTLRVITDKSARKRATRTRCATTGEALSRVLDRRGSGRQMARALGVSPASVSLWRSGKTSPKKRHRQALGITFSGQEEGSEEAGNPVVAWLKNLALWGKSAREKFLPAGAFTLPKEQLALLLNRLFATDGWASVLGSGQPQIGYASMSERLARQVTHLLLRFGVLARVSRKKVNYQGEQREIWQVLITQQASLLVFCEEIAIFGKEEALTRVKQATQRRSPNDNVDTIPAEVWGSLERSKGSRSWARLFREAGLACSNSHAGRRGLSRGRLLSLARALQDEHLADLASSDLFWDEVVAIEPTGCKQVYDLTIPQTHNFIANDICVHNTSFVLNVAINVAQPLVVGNDPTGYETYEQPGGACVIFSLEMPREQIASRILSSEARVDVQKMRGGRLQTEDWHNLTQAASFLSGLPIYIDDTPGITVLDVRSKVRRIQAELQRSVQATGFERKVGLVVIDYLQLMRGSEKAGSREQEISEISRGLKHLAKELRVPVIALSQLNRAVETRSEKSKRPQISDLRECVTGDTLVSLADGRRVPIRELVGQTPEVLAMNDQGQIVPARAELVWEVGSRPVFEISLASGRRLRATGRHRVYGTAGWIRVDELKPGDRLAAARRLPEPAGARSWPEDHLILLGHLVGDGSYVKHQPLRYTTASEENSEAVARAARGFGVEVNRHEGRGNWHQLVFSGNGNRWHPAGVNRWLRELGIYGQRSHEKRLPTEVFTLDNRSVATLLRHLWATDGCISPRKPGKKGSHRVSFATCSEGLAGDVAALLLRFEIVARIRATKADKGRPLYSVDVSGSDAQRTFLARIGAFGPRCTPAAALSSALEEVVANTNVDTLPVSVRAPIELAMQRLGWTDKDVSNTYGKTFFANANRHKAPSRSFVQENAKILGDKDLLTASTDDIFWDRVSDVNYLNDENVFDMTVPTIKSWIGESLLNHNSGALEQDADMIMFIYRDDYYNKETAHKGIAEIIVAKQRNGPTGKALLRWDSACTRFVDLEPGEIPEGIGDE